MKDYNDVKDNPDIEIGTIFRFDNYICEVEDYNTDNSNESIISIYKSVEDYEDGKYLEQVSLLNKNIKENIEDYMQEKYSVKIVSRLSLLLEIQEQLNHNLLIYSKNYLMSEPKKGYKREWSIAIEKCKIIQEMIRDERVKNINKKKQKNMER